MSSCQKEKVPPGAPPLDWYPNLYATDSRLEVIIRGKKRIRCSDQEFDEFTCLKTSEITDLQRAEYKRLEKCLAWEE